MKVSFKTIISTCEMLGSHGAPFGKRCCRTTLYFHLQGRSVLSLYRTAWFHNTYEHYKHLCLWTAEFYCQLRHSVSSRVMNDCLLRVLRLYCADDLTGCILHSCRKYSVHIFARQDGPGKAIFMVVALEPAIIFISGDMWQHGTLCSQITKGLQFKWEVGWCDSEWKNR